jgi:hypothetical protein
MLVLAFDLSKRTAWAMGEARSDATPVSGVWDIKQADRTEESAGLFAKHFRLHMKQHGIPDLLCIEQYMNPFAQQSDRVTISQMMLHGAAHAMAGVYSINAVMPNVGQVRKHFCGQATSGEGRDATKNMVLRRAIQLRYLPTGCTDDDRADACALFDWCVYSHLRKPVANFVLYGG